MREKLAIVFSFVLIFAFNSVDNAISPLVRPLAETFGVGMDQALWLISACTGGTVLGLILGPAAVAELKPRRALFFSLLLLTVPQGLFAMTGDFNAALAFRFFSGVAAGFIATLMWRLAFHGVSKAAMPSMLAVLMSARPLATAIGVPLAALGAWKMSWQVPVWIIAGAAAAAGLLLFFVYPAEAEAPAKEDRRTLFGAYKRALSAEHAFFYYGGFTVNRMAYFGFYSFCGLWFESHYGLGLKDMGAALLVIGLAETLINFATPALIRKHGHRKVFLSSIILSGLVLPAFIFGKVPLFAAVALIAAFMLLDRVYSMALTMAIPAMFPQAGDKTAFGSLNTLTAWAALMFISWFQGRFTAALGMAAMEWSLVAAFAAGSLALLETQRRAGLLSRGGRAHH